MIFFVDRYIIFEKMEKSDFVEVLNNLSSRNCSNINDFRKIKDVKYTEKDRANVIIDCHIKYRDCYKNNRVIFLAVRIFDTILGKIFIHPCKLTHVFETCIFIANKYEGAALCHYDFDTVLINTERVLLRLLEYSLEFATLYDFIDNPEEDDEIIPILFSFLRNYDSSLVEQHILFEKIKNNINDYSKDLDYD